MTLALDTVLNEAMNTSKSAKLILHVGMPKTGTSILQSCLNDLRSSRVDYSRLYRNAEIAHHSLARILLKGSQVERGQAVAQLCSYLCQSNGDTIVLSSESFLGMVTQPQLEVANNLSLRLGSNIDFQLVLVVREISSFLEAMYLQSSRFGKIRMSFYDYIISRRAWVDNLFHGIQRARGSHAFELVAPLLVKGFNTLEYFEEILELGSGALSRLSLGKQSTSRYGIKCETLLAFLEDFNEANSTSFTRSQVIKAFERDELFPGDTKDYSLYDDMSRASTYDHAMTCAKATSFSGYLDAFSGDYTCRPVRSLSLVNLAPADICHALEVLRLSTSD